MNRFHWINGAVLRRMIFVFFQFLSHAIGVSVLAVSAHAAQFRYYTPNPIPAKPAPLFVVLHGFSSSAKDIENLTAFSRWADQKGFYVLYPEFQVTGDWTNCWPYFLTGEQKPEGPVALSIVQKIKELVKKEPIDPERIYVVGMSAGASMASILAACHPQIFDGVVFHSGTSYGLSSSWTEALVDLKSGPAVWRTSNSACNPRSFKGRVMVIQGLADELVNNLHVDRLESDFLSDTEADETKIAETEMTEGFLVRDRIRDGQAMGRVVLINHWPHLWSRPSPPPPPKNSEGGERPVKAGPDATRMIVDYFL